MLLCNYDSVMIRYNTISATCTLISMCLCTLQSPAVCAYVHYSHLLYVGTCIHSVHVYSEYSLIRCNLFQRIWWINKFGGLTGYSLVLVHYIGTGKLWCILVDKVVEC